MARLDAFFKLMFDSGASDLHITSGQPPILRVHGELERVKYDPLDDETLRAMLYEIAPEQKIKTFEETGDIDFGYEIPGVARFRANYFMQKYGCGAVFRQIPTKVLTADDLGLPPILKKCAMLPKGLVLATLHTTSASKTIDRIIEVFPAEEQAQVRNGLSTGLKLVVAQNLFKRVDKKGRCAALEILVCTAAVGNLIREGKTVQIPSAIQTGKQFGMQTLDDAIMGVLQKGWISPEEAYDKCIDRTKFRPLLKTPPDELNQ